MRHLLILSLATVGFAGRLGAASPTKTEQSLTQTLTEEEALLPQAARQQAAGLLPQLQSPDLKAVDAALVGLREAGKSDGRFLSVLNDLSLAIATRFASASQLTGFEDRLRHTLDTAKNPQELDTLIAAIDAAKGKADASGAAVQSATLGGMSALLEKWQAYLSLVQTSNPAAANQILNDLVNDPNATAYYPSAKILERQVTRLSSTEGPDLDPVKTYRLIEPAKLNGDNLDEMINEIADRDLRDIPMMEDLPEALSRLKQDVVQLALGSGQRTLSDASYFEEEAHNLGPYAARIHEMYRSLKLEAIALGVHAGPGLQPTSGEDPEAYLQRIFAANKPAMNVDQIARAIDVARFALTPERLATPSPLTRSIQAYRFFLAGRRYEERQIWEMAARAYADALSVTEPSLPRDALQACLDSLKAAHPAEAAKAAGSPDPAGFSENIQAGGLYIPRHSP